MVYTAYVSNFFDCRSAGNWLFRGRRWLDPADPKDCVTVQSNYELLCFRFPHFGTVCTMAKLMEALGSVAKRWAVLCKHNQEPHFSPSRILIGTVAASGSEVSANFGPSASENRIATTSAASAAVPAKSTWTQPYIPVRADNKNPQALRRLPVTAEEADPFLLAPALPSRLSCRSDDSRSAGSDADWDGGVDGLLGPLAHAAGGGRGSDDWLMYDLLSDAADGGRQVHGEQGDAEELVIGRTVDELLDRLMGEPGASAVVGAAAGPPA